MVAEHVEPLWAAPPAFYRANLAPANVPEVIRMRGRLSVAAVVAAAVIMAPWISAEAGGDRFVDPRCDVYGFDYTSGEQFDDRCSGIDIRVGRAFTTRRAVHVDISYRNLEANSTASGTPFALWLDTDGDVDPEFLIRFAADSDLVDLGRVTDWADPAPEPVRCAGLASEVSFVTDNSSLVVPHRCVQTGEAIRLNLQSRNRYDDGKSWERDCFPEVRTWSGKTRHD